MLKFVGDRYFIGYWQDTKETPVYHGSRASIGSSFLWIWEYWVYLFSRYLQSMNVDCVQCTLFVFEISTKCISVAVGYFCYVSLTFLSCTFLDLWISFYCLSCYSLQMPDKLCVRIWQINAAITSSKLQYFMMLCLAVCRYQAVRRNIISLQYHKTPLLSTVYLCMYCWDRLFAFRSEIIK